MMAAAPALALQAGDTIGWDIGGAHVKACLLRAGQVLDVAQWPCPLWQGLPHLAAVLQLAAQRWPGLPQAGHAVTMTGEMADLFADRADGVARIAAALAHQLHPAGTRQPGVLRFFAGDDGWCGAGSVAQHWRAIASANWLATARHAALASQQAVDTAPGTPARGAGLLVDIGSTTTDLIAWRSGQVLAESRSDHQRLASGELVYQGVVRTPLCVLAQQLPWRGRQVNVMNELFATSADIYRLTGELDPAHDQQPAADGGPKTPDGSRARLARLIGLDAGDASAGDWLDLAMALRAAQLGLLQAQVARVLALHGLGPQTPLVTAGCGDFLARALAAPGTPPCRPYASAVARLHPDAALGVAAWAQVCAPAVAVAALWWAGPLAGAALHDHGAPRAQAA